MLINYNFEGLSLEEKKNLFTKDFASVFKQVGIISKYIYALWILSWDQETETPKDGLPNSYESFGEIYKQTYKLSTQKSFVSKVSSNYQLIQEIKKEDESWIKEHGDEVLLITEQYKEIKELLLVPKKIIIEYSKLVNSASSIWAVAKQESDFSKFAPVLDKIIKLSKAKLSYLETDELKGYNYYLNSYEEGTNIEFYDNFFDKLKKDLVPLIKSLKPIDQEIADKFKKIFPVDKQIVFNKYLLDVLGFPENKARSKTSVHPFTSGVSSNDVRITTAFHEDLLVSSIFATIHESGHAFYDLQNDPELSKKHISGQHNMAVHESQSRLLENMIGRNPSFWVPHFDKLKEIFAEELADVSFDEFIKYANNAVRDFIRIEADELTYPLHIMIRYEIEKEIFTDKLKVNQLPKRWNELVKEYLDLDVPNDAKGVLQDIHWSGGSFGYFPSYALGSAYSAQFYKSMDKQINVNEKLEANDFKAIKEWLRVNIHQYGMRKTPKELLFDATGEYFNPQYYVDYLLGKYSK